MKNRIFWLGFFLLSIGSLSAQNGKALSLSAYEDIRMNTTFNVPDYFRFRINESVSFGNFDKTIRPILRMGENDSLSLYQEDKDELDYTHYRYRQLYKGLEVEGAMIIAHVLAGRVESFNGEFFPDLKISENYKIDEAAGLKIALQTLGAATYRWQIPAEEADIKERTSNPAASWQPKGRLVICPMKGEINPGKFQLAWKYDIFAMEPLMHENIYVDANTGEIIYRQNLVESVDAKGSAKTKFSGTQAIVSDSLSSTSYRLRETGRGGGIITRNLANSTSLASAGDFTDLDNYWNNANANKDEIAGDVHWGAEKTYDYYKNIHGRNSYNNKGTTMYNFVHYYYKFNNAYWDGYEMVYGDGDGTSYNPFVGLDVCGHEMTHGVTGNSARLGVYNEPGALNESFSDIFGTCVEFYSKSTANWLIGENVTISGKGLRSMSDPKSFFHPNCYGGTYWKTGTYDNGYVHSNNGVQNFWFYILSMGKSGTNDFGDNYNIKALGIGTAAKIAYRTLAYYLTPYSQYKDTRFFSIVAVTDLYGRCSNEYKQTVNAWYAVGIGNPFDSTAKPLSGIYTIGGGSPNYANFTAAVKALVKNGICGPVTFKVRNGKYTEKVRIPYINGATPVSTVTFQSQSGDSSKVILTNPASSTATLNYTLNLDSAHYITFKNITIARTGTVTYANVIYLSGNASDNSFIRNKIYGKYAVGQISSGANSLIQGDGSDISRNVIQGNLLRYGSGGIYIRGTTAYPDHNKIIGNLIDSFGYYGVALDYAWSTLIQDNIIRIYDFTGAHDGYGIYIMSSDSGMDISGNKVNIYADGGYTRALYLAYKGKAISPASINNNFFMVKGGTASSAVAFDCDYADFFYNNLLNATNTSSSIAFNLLSYSNNSRIANNNFVCKGSGYAYYAPNGTLFYSNYNNLSSGGTNLARWKTTDCKTLAAWRTASSQDANSVNINPTYTTDIDLHVNAKGLHGAGVSITGITRDIDDEIRSLTTPDIGADEVLVPNYTNDAGLTNLGFSVSSNCAGRQSLKVTLRNYGKDSLKSVNIYVRMNGVTAINYPWKGSIAPGSVQSGIVVGTVVLPSGFVHFRTWSQKPNGIIDSAIGNDSFGVNYTFTPSPTAIPGATALVCPGQAVNLGTSPIVGEVYNWTSNPNGYSSSLSNPTVNPTTTTVYTILVTNLASGCQATDSVEIGVAATPAPKVTGKSTTCAGTETVFSTARVFNHNYSWRITGASTNSGSGSDTVKVSWLNPGVVEVIVTESVNATCLDSAKLSVTVDSAFVASFSATGMCLGDSLRLTNTTKNASTSDWKLNNIAYSSAKNAAINFSTAGINKISLFVQSSKGCSDTLSKFIKISPKPDAGWTSKYNSSNKSWSFSPADTQLKAYAWNFGDTTSSSVKFPKHAYSNFGTHKVSLGVLSYDGCSNTYDSSINPFTFIPDLETEGTEFIISPNPFTETAIISINLAKTGDYLLEMRDLEGRIVKIIANENMGTGLHYYKLDGQTLPAGIYLLRLNSSEGTLGRKLIKLD